MLRRGLCRVVSSSIAIPRRQLPPRALASRVYSVNMSPTPPSSPPSKRVKVNGADANGESSSASSSALQQYPIPPRDAGFTKRTKNRKKAREAALAKTGEEPIWFDIVQLLGPEKVQQVKDAEGKGDGEWVDRFSRDTILVGKVEKLSAHGTGLIIAPTRDWILAVPTVLPGETVKVRVDHNEMLYSKCDLVEVITPSPERRDDLIACKYFGECGGCQYQMLPYDRQLHIKRDVVTNAFAHFSKLDPALVPETLPTLESPEQYAYRTKLTPHFNLPKSLQDHRGASKGGYNKHKKGRRGGGGARPPPTITQDQDELERLTQQWADETAIGFDELKKGGKAVLDIEECPIATRVINKAIPIEKSKVKRSIASYNAGASLLLRDSMTEEAFGPVPEGTEPAPHSKNAPTRDGGPVAATEGTSEVITSYRSTVREKVEEVRFETPSGSFFQNNRSVLPGLVSYVREAIVSARTDSSSQEHYLVDTYCGSGLFALLLAPLFTKVAGVEISTESIAYAKRNAVINGMTNVEFLAGNAEEIFSKIEFESDKTTVVIDPPRRGCE